MKFVAKFSTLFIILILLVTFSISVATGYYLTAFPIYILIIIATSNNSKKIFKSIFCLCLVCMLVSSYLALAQLANVELSDLLTPIIALLSALAAYLILFYRTANQSSENQIHNDKLRELQILQQFSGSVAHDFNNVMSVQMGNAELLKDSLLQPENSKLFIDAILEALKKGTNLTQSLLSFAQKQFLQPVDIDLNQLILNHLADINLPINDRNKIHFTGSQDLWDARVDPAFFEESLLHLIKNAIQANSSHIKIELSNIIDNSSVDNTLEDSERYLLIVISDDGVGITDKHLKRIYQPFFTTRKAAVSKGLGLSVVWGFCQQSGGRIQVQSTLEQGTTFKVVVPATSPK